MRRAALRSGKRHEKPCVSHADNYEVLLIRVSHWLWKWYRETPALSYLSDAIEDMARIKQAFREPMKVYRAAAGERMRAYHAEKRRGSNHSPALP